MPGKVSDTTLAAVARAFETAAESHEDAFIDLGHAQSFLSDLEVHIAAFEAADIDQDEGGETQSGATAGFGPLLAEGLELVSLLDAFVHNFYRGNAAKLGEWKTASHVERQTKKPPTPPTLRRRPHHESGEAVPRSQVALGNALRWRSCTSQGG